ncbi:hypothetical protein [Hymenobacter negativus]|uniref:Uncharacterized protein n=1 Tax=Hymenobacter negativus TaxID=2795026 RepID=A0ABS3QAP9_9BACT|nr:hypothetical protein [Hymenobacter negativus]MBO2008325.1 hypothetical protein [Hymenobacter negativus]
MAKTSSHAGPDILVAIISGLDGVAVFIFKGNIININSVVLANIRSPQAYCYLISGAEVARQTGKQCGRFPLSTLAYGFVQDHLLEVKQTCRFARIRPLHEQG